MKPPEQVDLILKHGCIFTQNADREVIQDGAIAIRGGRIVAIGVTNEITQSFKADEMMDMTDRMIFPGLINVHDHLFQVSTKGLGEDMPVQDWVGAVTAPTAIHIKPEEKYIFCLIGCLELIHSGVTTTVDMSYAAREFALHERNFQAIQDSGMRGNYSSLITDYGVGLGVTPDLMHPIDWWMEDYARLLTRFPQGERVVPWISVGAAWTVSDEGIKATQEFAREWDVPITMHINENAHDNNTSIDRFGKRVVPYLSDIGFLEHDLLAVHCVDMDDEDIRLFVENDIKVAYNPISNMYLGSGIPQMVEMDRAGLDIGIGVDGAGSNNSQDMIESLKAAALLQKVRAQDASVIDAQKVLDWATCDAAAAIWMEDEIGSLEVGKQADLFAMQVNSTKFVPVHDPIASLVYSSGQENVVLTMVNGEILMKERVIQGHDEAALIRQCQSLALGLADRCGSNSRLKRSWRPSSWQTG
jgi:5-methylthioadenosine/S-adenosylhomocysteine deaminase